jgi:predicted GIY-YIG superfamily endonuclease
MEYKNDAKQEIIDIKIENKFDDEYFKLIDCIDDFLFEDKIYISNYGEIYNSSQYRLYDYESSSVNLKVINEGNKSFSRWNLTTNNFDISNGDYENKRRLKKLSYGYAVQNKRQYQKNKIKKTLDPKVIINNEGKKDTLCINSNTELLDLELYKYKYMYNELLNQKINLEKKIEEIEEKIKQQKDFNNKYIKTIIYMIRPKRNNFYMYVGHTTDKERRLREHIRSTDSNNTKLYNTIRETGGWEHWEMIEIGIYECKSREDALKREQEWCEKLRPNLNSVSPFS